MDQRPVVGIVAHGEAVDLDGAPVAHRVVAEGYARAVRKAGALPVLLPLVEPGDVDDLLDRVDALVVTGGVDVDPPAYGRAREDRCGPSDPLRDAADIAFVRAAAARNLPTLCICRGVQVMNVAFGGTLVQHVDDHMRTDRYNVTVHDVRVVAGTTLAGIVGAERIGVNTMHHQVIDLVGDGVRVVAWSDDDLPEAIVVDGAPRLLGVQWHPEYLRHRAEHLALFEALIDGPP